MNTTHRRSVGITLMVVTALGLAACTASADSDTDDGAESFPMTIDNCGTSVTFEEPPQRVMLLESAPVTILDGIGVFDRVIARAGFFPPEYYEPDLAAAVEEVPSLTDDLNASGHLQISQEAVIAEEPDLVLGLPDGISRQSLADAGINVLVQEEYCGDDDSDSETEAAAEPGSFDTLFEEIERYGQIFDRQQEADQLVDDLDARIEQVHREHPEGEQTAAVLYPTTAGGTMYAYGSGSMAQPQLEGLGLTNVFADNPTRVFEVQTEAVVAADPDVIVLLYQGSEDGITETVTSLPGAQDIEAVAQDRLITQMFNFTAPASPLTVDGLERMADQLDGQHEGE